MTEHEKRYKRHREFMRETMAEISRENAFKRSPEGRRQHINNWINDNLGPKGFYTNLHRFNGLKKEGEEEKG